jgi:hypothetical protein
MGVFNKIKKIIGLSDEPKTQTNEYARVLEWSPQWDMGAPMPQVFSNGSKVFLIYLISTPEPDWDGTSIHMIDAASGTEYPLALVEFSGHTFRFGIANDEVFSGLPLAYKGLRCYEAHIIENSTWMAELKAIHKVHPRYSEGRWKAQRHFSLLFHDQIFEVIATEYQIETFKTTFEKLAVEVAERMNKRA